MKKDSVVSLDPQSRSLATKAQCGPSSSHSLVGEDAEVASVASSGRGTAPSSVKLGGPASEGISSPIAGRERMSSSETEEGTMKKPTTLDLMDIPKSPVSIPKSPMTQAVDQVDDFYVLQDGTIFIPSFRSFRTSLLLDP